MLQCASPFSPVTGPRLLVREGADVETGRKLLLGGALTLTERLEASSLHVTFPTQDEWRFMGEQGMLLRQDQQYHWLNAGYETFDDFLAALSSSRRKTIRRERKEAQADVDIVALTGADITEDHWDGFFGFYMDTGARKWGRPYLNRTFFSLLGERMADRVMLIMARRSDRWIAGALLSGHRARDPAWPAARRGRRPGTTQDRPRLFADPGLLRPLDRRPGAARTRPPLPRPGTRSRRLGNGAARRGLFAVQGRRARAR